MKLHITKEWLRAVVHDEPEIGVFAAGGLFLQGGNTMHYRNGREAKNGDMIVQIGWDGKVSAVGILYGATAGNDYCNGMIAPIGVGSGACMVDCLHMDDIAEMLKEKGLDKRPAGK